LRINLKVHHRGHRDVGLFGRGESTYRELSQYQKTGKPFHCYVNPARPEQALLYRDLDREPVVFWRMFAILFSLVGFVFISLDLWTLFRKFCIKRPDTDHELDQAF